MNEDNNTNPPKKGITISPKVLNDFKTGNTPANSPFGYRANQTYLNGFTGENMDHLTGYEDYTNYKGKNYTGLYNTIDGLRGENQSASNKLVKGVGRLTTRALGEVAKIPGYAGGLIGGIFADEGEGWDTAFNNFWVRGIEDAIGSINEHVLDVYNNDDYKNLGLRGKIATAGFWATEGADGVGYLLAMMAPGALLNRLKLGSSLLRNSTTVSSLSNKERQLSTLEGLSKLGVNADRVDSSLITISNTYMEAASEAGNAMRTFEESKPKFIEQHTSEKLLDLKRDFVSGNISEEEYTSRQNQIMADAETAFNQQKGRLGRDIFFANAAILLGPNAIQTNILFGKGASKYVTDLAKPKTYQSALKGLGIGVLSEGFFEEGMQSTVEGIFSKKAEDNQLATNMLNDFTIGDIIEGYADTLTSVEGQSAIFLGSFLGGTMNMVGQIRSDRNDYKVSQAIATKFGTLPGDMLKTVNSIYKKDKDGNIVLDKNNNPQIDLEGAKLAAYRHIGSDTMNQIQDNALLENDEDLVRYIKETYASDLGMSFGLLDNNEQVRNASGEALNQYLEDQITAIQENTKLDDATKEIMIKDAQETAAIARKMYNKTIQMNDALQVLQGSISPELDSKFEGPSAEEAKRAFLTAQRIDIIRNRYNSGLLNDTIERKRNKLKNLLDTLEIPEVEPDYLHRAPTEADYEGGTLLAKRAAQNPLTAALQQEIESLEEYKKEVDSEYTNTLTKPEYMSKELTEVSNEIAAENKRSNLDYKFNEIAENISKAKNINELDKIKLDPTLKDTHKDAFDAAIGKKRAELNKIKKEQEAGVKAQNQFADNVITEINNITYSSDPGISLSDSVSLDSTTIQSSQEVDPNNIEGEVFSDSEGYLFRLDEDNPSFTESGRSHWESAEQRATREANEEIANELKNKESQEPQEKKEEVVKSKNIDEEKGLNSEDDGTPSEEETPDEVTSNDPVEYIFPEPTKLNTGTVEDITVPDDPDNLAENEVIEGGVNENDTIANIDLNNTPEDVETKYSIQDGNIMIHFITRLPRLVFDTSQKVGEKVWDYLNNHRSKANDVYNIKVWTHNKNRYANTFPAAQPGLRAYEKLVRFQKQGGEALTIEDYENLLYRLPLLATLSTDSDIQMWIDGLSENNFEIVDGKVRMKKDTSYGFINAFNIRLQIINALLQDVDTPISLKFAKQIKGKLNVNRDANGRSVMSDISKMAEFRKLSEDREAQIKAIQESLAYVDTNRIVRGLANGETISGGAKTPGIIYVRLANRDGSIQNIQVSRKKVSDDAGDSGVSTLEMLVMMIQDATKEGNPYTMKFDDFIGSMVNRENADMINKRFEKVKTILNEHNPNYTVYDFFNFFYHTSSNNKTKLNFQEGHIYVGRLVEKLGIPADVLSQYVKESPDGLLYMNSDALSTDEGAKILKGYLNMLKQHVRVDLAKDPMYIEYLMDNVLMTDIKPEETFTLNFKGYERKNGRVVFHKGNRPLESNVFVSNLVSTPNVDRVMKIPNEVIENMPPELRAITERVGLSTEVVNKPSNVGGGQATTTSVQSETGGIINAMDLKEGDKFTHLDKDGKVTTYTVKEKVDNIDSVEEIITEEGATIRNPSFSRFGKQGWVLNKVGSATQQNQTKESQPTSQQSADISIGEIPNTNYEVKSDGVYFEGKKLDNPNNLSHRQLVESDIKRRREEDLDAINEMAALQLLLTLSEATFSSVPITKGKLMEGEFNGGLRVYTPLKSLQGKKAETNIKGIWISFTSEVGEISAPSQKAEVDKINDELYSEYKEINAKYDAEIESLNNQTSSQQNQSTGQQSASQQTVSKTISTLESQPAPTHNTASYTIVPSTQSTTETQIAEIEKRRQEEKNRKAINKKGIFEQQQEFENNLKENQEIPDYSKVGAKYNEGSDVIATFRDETSESFKGESYMAVVRVIKPAIIENGKLIQAAQIEVGRFDSKESADNWYATIKEREGKVLKQLEDEIDTKYDAEYVEAVKKGEMTKEQAMQALEEAGRKNSSAYAEIAALETQPIASQQSITSEQKPTNKVITKDTVIDSGVLYMRGTEGAGLYLSNEDITKGFKNVDFRMLYDDAYPTEAEVLERLDNLLTRYGEDKNVKYIARKVGDMWMILQEGKDANLLSVHFQVTERGTPRRGSHSAVVLKLPKDVTVNQEGLNNILPMINQFRANNYEMIDGRLRPKNKENDTTLDLNLISSNVSQQPSSLESKPEAIRNTENNNQNPGPKSKLYEIGNTHYRISGDPTKGYVVKHARTGRVLKPDELNYKKVLVAHRPDLKEHILPEKKKAAKKLKKFTVFSAAEYIEEHGLTLETAVLLYFARGGTVSRKGVQENEKGRKWYEGKDGLKASATWETVAEHIMAEYSDEYDFDEKELSDEVEAVMLSYSRKSELNEDVINKANELRDANEGILSEEDLKDVIYHQGGHQLLSIYEIENAEQNLSEEEKINYYEQEYLKTLNSLPVEEQIKLYEEIDEATPVPEYDGRASSEVSSFAESSENISRTSEAIKQASTETSESTLSELKEFFNNADMRNKVKTLMTMMSISNIKLTPTMMNANNIDSTFKSVLENIEQGNKVSELLNKICTK